MQRGLARAREFSLEAYEAGWRRIVAEATAWLPDQPLPRMRSISTLAPQRAAALEQAQAGDVHWLEQAADVMDRDYVVYSNAPLVGPLITWVRRNLTSHLREPYLDPALERQVAFNREVVSLLRRILVNTESGVAHPANLADLSQQISHLEAQLDVLQQQVAALRSTHSEWKG